MTDAMRVRRVVGAGVMTFALVMGCDAPQLPPPSERAVTLNSAPRAHPAPCPSWTEADYAGCDRVVGRTEGIARAPAGLDGRSAGAEDGPGTAPHLRLRTDPMRGRLWVLGLDDVKVYDLTDHALLRRIALPPWSVARGICVPDMALDDTGSAYIAANAHPTVYRIDGASFRIDTREIRLLGKEDWSIGFGALAFDANGALHGLVAFGNSRWRIDVERGLAELLERYDPPLQRCTLAPQTGPV